MVAVAAIESPAEGELVVSGELNFSSVGSLLAESACYFKSNAALQINLAHVSHSNSAGVALLLEWMRMAKLQNSPIFFSDIPAQMWAIIEVSELSKRLPISKGS